MLFNLTGLTVECHVDPTDCHSKQHQCPEQDPLRCCKTRQSKEQHEHHRNAGSHSGTAEAGGECTSNWHGRHRSHRATEECKPELPVVKAGLDLHVWNTKEPLGKSDAMEPENGRRGNPR